MSKRHIVNVKAIVAEEAEIFEETTGSKTVVSEPVSLEIAKEATEEFSKASAVPKAVRDFSSAKLLSCACVLTAFAVTYNALIIPYRDSNFAGPHITTEPSVVEAVTEITAPPETTEASTEDERPTAVPVTKRYVPNPNRVKPKVSAPATRVELTVPYFSQNPDFPTGCEAASATMLLNYYGIKASVREMVNAIPRANLYSENGRVYGPSIYEKFVGDPTGTYDPVTGSTRRGFGAFAPVVTSAMNRVIANHGGGYVARNITGASVNRLFEYIRAGHPVIIWGTSGMQDKEFLNTWWIKSPKGDYEFSYPKGTHVLVLMGFDKTRAFFLDPWSEGTRRYMISAFADKYQLLGYQAIIIEKGDPNTGITTEPSATTTTEKQTTTTTLPPDNFEYVTDEFGERVTDEDGNEVTQIVTEPDSSETSEEESSSDENTSNTTEDET